MDSGQRSDVLEQLATYVLGVVRPHPVRVAIDGCSAAGKTTLANELAAVTSARTQRTVIRVSIDHFKRLIEYRVAYPIDSPECYYLDSWNNTAIREDLLGPLGPGGNRRYRSAVADLAGRNAVNEPEYVAAEDAIVLADGCFLQRPELNDFWDARIFIDVDFDDVLRRGTERDQAFMDSAAAARHRYLTRYIPGEQMYINDCAPAAGADIVVDNRDFAAPRLRYVIHP